MNGLPIAVLGAGSWGTALAVLIARNGFQVKLWDFFPEHLAAIEQTRENKRYLPGVSLPENVETIRELATLITLTHQFLLVVPSHGFRATLNGLKQAGQNGKNILISWGTKGFDPERSMLLSDVVTEIYPAAELAAVSGPSFANEVAHDLPTALTVASPVDATANTVAEWLRSDRIRVYTNNDLAGVQLGGAIKNVMALAAGISDGLGFGANTRAALITRGLTEMNRLGVALGGRPQTFMGLTGVGDLVLTCTDNQSRNRRAGIGIGQGRAVAELLQEIGQEVEGIKTVRELYTMAKQVGVDMPITEQVYRVVYQGIPAKDAVVSLLSREPKPE
ncbi:MAG: NAD(P)H-dependent glycerol-3-phosphate dehydrogenase [Arenicellales bacterium]|nr:NAD(P)H-dependent glycerol-3-phosphate dehydrogenase [Arenicellales bacterium]